MPAITVDELQVLISAQTEQFKKEIADIQKQLSALNSHTNKISKSVSKSFGAIGTAAVAMGTVIGNAITSAMRAISGSFGDAVRRLDIINNFPAVMAGLGQSADDSRRAIEYLSAKLLGLPTSLDQAALGVQRFTSANNNVLASSRIWLALNNAILAGGAPIEIQQSALEQLTQAYARGKPELNEWRSAMTAMPAQLQQVARAMGFVNAQQLGEALTNARVSMDEFIATVVRLNEQGIDGLKSFEEQARDATGGVGTSIVNLKIAMVRALADIMNTIGQANIAAFFNGIAKAISAVVPYVVAIVKVIASAVSFITGALGRLFGKDTSKQAKSVADSANATNQAIAGAAAGASKIAQGLDNATASAKKLRGQLAAFDEMNVLQEPTAGGGGGAVGGGSPDVSGIATDLGDVAGQIDKIGDKAEAIANKIKGWFRGLGQVISDVWNSAPVQGFFAAINTAWGAVRPNIETGISNIVGLFRGIGAAFSEAWSEFAPRISANIQGLFGSIGNDIMLPALELASKIFADFTGSLRTTWDRHGKSIASGVVEFVNNIIGTFRKIYDDILGPIIKPFLEELKETWDRSLKPMVDRVVNFVAVLADSALRIYNQFVTPIINWIVGLLAPVFVGLGNTIGGVFNTVLRTVGDVMSAIFGILTGVVNFVTGIFTGDWRRAWEGVKGVFTSIWDGLAAIVKAPINAIIDLINGFISGINKIKVPDWVPGVGGKGINIPKIPKLATGGIAMAPTLALFGEAGREAVLPLDRNTGWMDELAARINGNGQPLHITVKLGEETILERIIEGINDQAFMRNENMLTI